MVTTVKKAQLVSIGSSQRRLCRKCQVLHKMFVRVPAFHQQIFIGLHLQVMAMQRLLVTRQLRRLAQKPVQLRVL